MSFRVLVYGFDRAVFNRDRRARISRPSRSYTRAAFRKPIVVIGYIKASAEPRCRVPFPRGDERPTRRPAVYYLHYIGRVSISHPGPVTPRTRNANTATLIYRDKKALTNRRYGGTGKRKRINHVRHGVCPKNGTRWRADSKWEWQQTNTFGSVDVSRCRGTSRRTLKRHIDFTEDVGLKRTHIDVVNVQRIDAIFKTGDAYKREEE